MPLTARNCEVPQSSQMDHRSNALSKFQLDALADAPRFALEVGPPDLGYIDLKLAQLQTYSTKASCTQR